tara:strand:+ start:166 stop:876 length:711 start_codon:yes stop_codon:yes gene_type:complete
MFSQAVIEQLQYYVYCLTDPTRSHEVFYIGKGIGNRVFHHMENALGNMATPSDKLDRIRSIHEASLEVGHNIIRHGMDEATAFEVEAALIDFADKEKLTNLQSGHHCADYGIKTVHEVNAMYEAEPFATDLPVLLINVNRLFTRKLTPEQLYDATRKSWVVGPRRNLAKYAVATYRGLTREAYEINEWYPVKVEKKTRWAFHGSVAQDIIRKELIYKDIGKLFSKGAANPIKYHKC